MKILIFPLFAIPLDDEYVQISMVPAAEDVDEYPMHNLKVSISYIIIGGMLALCL
jgi:hypothetical protein